jgi:integrase/recombinase XerC
MPNATSSEGDQALIKMWLEPFAENTRDIYTASIEAFERSSCRSILDLLGEGQAVVRTEVLAFKNTMLKEEAAPATINVRLAALRSLVRHARRLGVVQWTLDVQGVRVDPVEPSGPDATSFAKLLEETAPVGIKGTRDRAILWLLFGLGLRRAEVVSLDVVHVDLAGAVVQVLGRGRRERVVMTLSAEVVGALAEWLEARGTAPGPMFVSLPRGGTQSKRISGRDVHRIVDRLGRLSGVGDVSPQRLRDGGITAALDLDLDMRSVQRFSRISDPRNMMRYDDARRGLGVDVAQNLGASVRPNRKNS